MNNIINEFKKDRHLHVWIIPVISMLALGLWMGVLVNKMGKDELLSGYETLFYQFPIINALIFPIMIAVIVSRLCDIEIKGDKIKEILVYQTKKSFFSCKYMHEVFYVFLVPVFEVVYIYIIGKKHNFTDSMGFERTILFFAAQMAAALFIVTLQNVLSLHFTNQIVSLFVGMAGAFLGLFGSFMPVFASRFIPWSYFYQFETSIMNYDAETRTITYENIDFPYVLFVAFVVFIGIFYFAGRSYYIKKEEC